MRDARAQLELAEIATADSTPEEKKAAASCAVLAAIAAADSAATAGDRDSRGLRFLRDKLGTRFKAGAVLYTGDKTLPFGDRLAAVSIAGLWSS